MKSYERSWSKSFDHLDVVVQELKEQELKGQELKEQEIDNQDGDEQDPHEPRLEEQENGDDSSDQQ